MFGYITVNKPELKIKDFDCYHSYYCGLCRALKENYGRVGQLTLTYDCAFLALLLTALYEPAVTVGQVRCAAHPTQKHRTSASVYTDYAADMNVLLSYYQCLDDWQDEKKRSKAVLSAALKSGWKKAAAKHPGKAQVIAEGLQKIRVCEQEKDLSIDRAAGCFGEILAEILAVREDEWSPHLRRMGFYLGKFIYLMDAFEDVEKDQKTGNYNPFLGWYGQEDFEERCQTVLNMMMAECCRAFERLPIIENAEILRNILYAGVWLRFELVRKERAEKQEAQEHEGGTQES